VFHHRRPPGIDAYLALFGDTGPELDRWYGGWAFIPKATSANAVYAAVEQTQAIQLDAAAVPPLPHTGVALIMYGPEKLGISLWNAIGRVLHNRRISGCGPVIVRPARVLNLQASRMIAPWTHRSCASPAVVPSFGYLKIHA
jgi:hypothetical protein